MLDVTLPRGWTQVGPERVETDEEKNMLTTSQEGRRRRRALVRTAAAGCLGLTLVAAGAAAADATAKSRTYQIDGYFHTAADGTVRSTGDFVGTYTLTKEVVHRETPFGSTVLKVVDGTDEMAGFLDRNHNGRRSSGEPRGVLVMAYERVATFHVANGKETFVESACTHPVTATRPLPGRTSTRFTGGLIFMTDITQPDGTIRSDYRGTVTVRP